MLRAYIDHITITAPSLAAGVDYVREILGVSPQAGGEHPRMGTHNYLLRLGDMVFLEVIAINPDAVRPDRPRWFALDVPDATRVPRLATWVVRTDDIHAAVAAAPIPLGKVEPLSRGAYNWHITIPQDGSLPLQGIAPTLIQWQALHPASMLQESGCTLVRLEGFHPQAEKVSGVLDAIGFNGEFSVSPLPPGERPYLVAHIETPAGPRRLSARAISQQF